jgi:L-histidine Nalpha-methyltransferase
MGFTAAFNINLLTRLNREAGAEFDTAQFSHFPCYDPETGANRSFLISMTEQDVYVAALEKSIHFDRWETIQTEISQKYDTDMIRKMMALAGLNILEFYYDEDHYFTDVLVSGT